MADIFTSGLGGMEVMRSAIGDASLYRSRANAEIERERTFAAKLKEVQNKAAAQVSARENPEEDKKLREVCREMESVFLNILLSKMRDTIPERALFPQSSGEKMMQSMLDIELTRSMAGGGGIGLGEMLYQHLSRPVVSPDSIPAKK